MCRNYLFTQRRKGAKKRLFYSNLCLFQARCAIRYLDHSQVFCLSDFASLRLWHSVPRYAMACNKKILIHTLIMQRLNLNWKIKLSPLQFLSCPVNITGINKSNTLINNISDTGTCSPPFISVIITILCCNNADFNFWL